MGESNGLVEGNTTGRRPLGVGPPKPPVGESGWVVGGKVGDLGSPDGDLGVGGMMTGESVIFPVGTALGLIDVVGFPNPPVGESGFRAGLAAVGASVTPREMGNPGSPLGVAGMGGLKIGDSTGLLAGTFSGVGPPTPPFGVEGVFGLQLGVGSGGEISVLVAPSSLSSFAPSSSLFLPFPWCPPFPPFP
jgi:hypothetical protein